MQPISQQSTGQTPVMKPTRLIVLVAFKRDEEGELRPAIEPRECPSESSAATNARLLAGSGHYDGVLAWWRSADLINGEFGEPVEIYRWGEVPEME